MEEFTGIFAYIYMNDKKLLKDRKAPDEVFNKYSIEQVTETLIAAGFTRVSHFEEKGYYIKAL